MISVLSQVGPHPRSDSKLDVKHAPNADMIPGIANQGADDKNDSAGDELLNNERCEIYDHKHMWRSNSLTTLKTESTPRIRMMTFEQKIKEYLESHDRYRALTNEFGPIRTEDDIRFVRAVRIALAKTANAMSDNIKFNNQTSESERVLDVWFRTVVSGRPSERPLILQPVRNTTYGYMKSINPARIIDDIQIREYLIPYYVAYIATHAPSELHEINRLREICAENHRQIGFINTQMSIIETMVRPVLAASMLPNGLACCVFDKQQADDQKRRIRNIVQLILGCLSFVSFIVAWQSDANVAGGIGILVGVCAIAGICIDHYIDANCDDWSGDWKWALAVVMGYLPAIMYNPTAWSSQADAPIQPYISRAQKVITQRRAAHALCCRAPAAPLCCRAPLCCTDGMDCV